jgi:hypothetical protein
MPSWVIRQILYSATVDSDFLCAWIKMSAAERESMQHDLCFLDRRRKELSRCGFELWALHAEAAQLTKTWFGDVPEFDRPSHIKPPALRIELARNPDWKQRAYEYGAALLGGSVAASPVPVVRFYGGIKEERAIESKIHAYRVGDPLDLDDVIRFRFVLANLNEMVAFYRFLEGTFALDRCRNYYARPRHGLADPYRALHLRIAGLEDSPVEIQLQSGLRDAVGTIDHSLVLKRSVDYISLQHSQWLNVISLVANIVDAERAHDRAWTRAGQSGQSTQTFQIPAANHG